MLGPVQSPAASPALHPSRLAPQYVFSLLGRTAVLRSQEAMRPNR